MRCLAALLALVCLAEAKPAYLVGVAPSISFDPYILGGTEARVGEIPWQLSQQRGGSHSCGASLLRPGSALSAAHCVDGAPPADVRIVAGLHLRSDESTAVASLAESFLIHPSYNVGEGTFPNDIAIIYLLTNINSAPVENIDFALLPPDNVEQFVGFTCVLSGWGRTSASNTLPDALQKVSIDVITTAECDSRMAAVAGADCTDAHIAVFDPALQKGSCNGDSGGPMNCPLSGEFVVAGVTSWGISGGGACLPEYPSVYTRTGFYRQWIIDNIR